MKTRILTVACSLAVIGAAFALSSCDKPEPENQSENKITIDFEEVYAPETDTEADATRTAYHEKTIWWKTGDQISYCQYASVSGVMTYKGVYTTLKSDQELASATISLFNTPFLMMRWIHFWLPSRIFRSHTNTRINAILKMNRLTMIPRL